MVMNITVRTLKGSQCLDIGDFDIDGLKARLHADYGFILDVPAPELQNLVFCGRRLDHGSLKAAGVTPGSTVVVLETAPMPSAAPQHSVPAPTTTEIRAAIFSEARSRGIEHKLLDEVPSAAHAALGLPTNLLDMDNLDMDNQLMGLIEALEGRLGLLRQGAGGAARGGAAAAGAGAGAGAAGELGAAPAAPAEPEPDIVPPEPEADHISQMTDMGFSDSIARKALLLHRNRVPEAVEWLLMHADDADADTPVTQEQLRRVYGPPAARGGATAGGAGGAAAALAGIGGDATSSAAAGAVASALRELHMSLMQAVGMDADGGEGGLGGLMGVGGPGGGLLAAGGAGAVGGVDPLAEFRRRLQQQLGVEGLGGDEADAPAALSDLFPLEALMSLQAAAGDGADMDDDDMGDDDLDEDEDDEDDDDDGGAAPHVPQF
ncbi:hypothetical protein FOA52_000850 [Chlamydomonas sp. UWO 241]|nr:hypothetical protein FOA52_000850 [Chlamydomonas sp. UWO 241]